MKPTVHKLAETLQLNHLHKFNDLDLARIIKVAAHSTKCKILIAPRQPLDEVVRLGDLRCLEVIQVILSPSDAN